MKIYKIGNIYAVLTRTKKGNFLDYTRTRELAISKGLERVKESLHLTGNLLVL